MAEEEVDDSEDDEEGGKTRGKKMLLVIVLLVLLLGGGGAGVFFSGMLDEETPETAETEGEEKTEDTEKAQPEIGPDGELIGMPVYYELPEFIVNLSVTGKRTSFLKMKVTLELGTPEEVPMMDANLPRIQDTFTTYLRELRASDLAGSAGIYRLREELLLRVNKAVEPAKVRDILFSEMIVQ